MRRFRLCSPEHCKNSGKSSAHGKCNRKVPWAAKFYKTTLCYERNAVAIDIGKILLVVADKQKTIKTVRSEIKWLSGRVIGTQTTLDMCTKAYNDLARQVPELEKQLAQYKVTLDKKLEWLAANESQEDDAQEAERLALKIKKMMKEVEKLKSIQAGMTER